MPTSLPIIDIAPLLGYLPNGIDATIYDRVENPSESLEIQVAIAKVAQELYEACTTFGFFYIKSNVYPMLPQLISTIQSSAKDFFTQPVEVKRRIDMTSVGPAWRGYFSVGDELTSGKPDIKEGLYFGSQLSLEDPRSNNLPMHGPNVFPRSGAKDSSYSPESHPQYHSSFQYEQTANDKTLEESILQYLLLVKSIGFAIIDGMSLSLELPRYYLRNILLRRDNSFTLDENQLSQLHGDEFYDPLCLYRVFNYPSLHQYQSQYEKHGFITHDASNKDGLEVTQNETHEKEKEENKDSTIFSVGEHCDYGGVTILFQDNSGGLEVRDLQTGQFIPAPPLPNTFICNIGDTFEKLTHGVFVSTPHRVNNPRATDRISFPFFFDPGFSTPLQTIIDKSPKLIKIFNDKNNQEQTDKSTGEVSAYRYNQVYKRWDGVEVGLSAFQGQYGDYILQKVSKVFPQLAKAANIHQQ